MEDDLTKLAWQMIKTKCHASEVVGFSFLSEHTEHQDDGPGEDAELAGKSARERLVECVTFENFAMLLNLINNVYIKNNN